MSDTLGPITIPTPVNSGLTFPLTSDFGYGTSNPYQVITHRFGDEATLATQSFFTGMGPVKHTFRRANMSQADVTTLIDFYEAVEGSFQSFTYNAPQSDGTFQPVQVVFDFTGLSLQQFANAVQGVGVTFVEAPDFNFQSLYPINHTVTRFPNDQLTTELTSQVQQIIPLVHIKVLDASVPDMYISDRRVTVGDNLYLPRLLDVGEPGTNVIMSQNITGAADNVQFSFGNADRSMTKLCNATELKFASIDLCLYFVSTGTLLQLWKGFVQNFTSDPSAVFTMQCSDGIFKVTQPYPTRTVTRSCWKKFNDGINCPFSTQGTLGAQASGTSCSYQFDDSGVGNPDIGNGCLQHSKGIAADGTSNPGMTRYFGGVPIIQQGVKILDNSTGFLGFDRNAVTATSIVSDSIWGQVLPEIW